jgi:hypothetical protein
MLLCSVTGLGMHLAVVRARVAMATERSARRRTQEGAALAMAQRSGIDASVGVSVRGLRSGAGSGAEIFLCVAHV